jgi:energy-coupling factor transporter transmembrane protein EcfT
MARLHPLTKLALLGALTLVAFSASGPVVAGLFILLAATVFCLRHHLLGSFLGVALFHRRMLAIVPLAFPLFWLMTGDVGTGSWMALVFLCRLGVLALAAAVFVATTGQDQMIHSLTLLRLPFSIAFMTTVAIRFVPVLLRELKDILDAQRARCYRVRPGNIQALVIPAALSLLKRSHEVTLAMWSKGYRGTWRETRGKLPFGWLDVAVMASIILLGGAVVLL